MPTIDAAALTDFAAHLLRAGGYGAEPARRTAELLVWANLRGVESHGVLRIPRYVEMVTLGMIVPDAQPSEVRAFGATALLDGGKCPGAVGLAAAAERAAPLARAHGIGWCAIRNTSHCGAIGYFTSALARKGLVGIAMSASKPLMSYHGAKGEALSTNPLSIAVPSRDGEPIVLDMSTAAVALGKVMAAKDAGQAIPEGWGVDAEGRATTDPARVAAVLPMAGPKGSGLSLMIELLTSVVAHQPLIAPVLLGGKSEGFNGVVAAIDPAAFGDPEAFADGVSEVERAIHRLDPVDSAAPVLLPGQRGATTARTRSAEGVPLAKGTADRLVKLAGEFGCEVPASLR